MGSLAEKAVNNHKSFYTCSGAVLCAFADKIGMSEAEAKSASMPFAGGRACVTDAAKILEKMIS